MHRNISFPITLMKSKSGFMVTPRLHMATNPGNDTPVSVDALCGPILGFGAVDAGKSAAEDLIAPESSR